MSEKRSLERRDIGETLKGAAMAVGEAFFPPMDSSGAAVRAEAFMPPAGSKPFEKIAGRFPSGPQRMAFDGDERFWEWDDGMEPPGPPGPGFWDSGFGRWLRSAGWCVANFGMSIARLLESVPTGFIFTKKGRFCLIQAGAHLGNSLHHFAVVVGLL